MKETPTIAAVRNLLRRLAETHPRPGLSAKQHEAALSQLSDRAQSIGCQLIEVHRKHLGNRPNDVAGLAGSLIDALTGYANDIGRRIVDETNQAEANAAAQNAEVAGHLRELAAMKRKAANTTDKPKDAAVWQREATRLEALADELEAN